MFYFAVQIMLSIKHKKKTIGNQGIPAHKHRNVKSCTDVSETGFLFFPHDVFIQESASGCHILKVTIIVAYTIHN
jgi:hypothetical protein